MDGGWRVWFHALEETAAKRVGMAVPKPATLLHADGSAGKRIGKNPH